uniref:G protein-coupled receptor n=1 Tax=Rhabditophanes sp. KR3021 TaxID=114890 RepID=A0AC35TPU7_9BILA
MTSLNDNLFDNVLKIVGTVGLLLNIGAFLIIHFKKSKNSNEFTSLNKWSRIPDAFLIFMIAFAIRIRIVGDYCFGAMNGLLSRFQSDMLNHLAMVVTIVSIHYIIYFIVIAFLMRYNVLVLGKPKLHFSLLEKIMHPFVWVFLPLVTLGYAPFAFISPPQFFETFPNATFVLTRYPKEKYSFLVYDCNIFSYLFLAVIINSGVEVQALEKSTKECRFKTSAVIKQNIVKLRFIVALPVIFAAAPFGLMIAIGLVFPNVFSNHVKQNIINYLIPASLSYFLLSPFQALYHTFGGNLVNPSLTL